MQVPALEAKCRAHLLAVSATRARAPDNGKLANATMLPFFEFANALAANSSTEDAPLTIDTAITVPYQSFGDWERQFFANATGQVGGNTELGSRLLPRDIIESQPEEVAETVLAVPNIQY